MDLRSAHSTEKMQQLTSLNGHNGSLVQANHIDIMPGGLARCLDPLDGRLQVGRIEHRS